MNRHLGVESSLNFHQVGGELINRKDYRVIKTKSRPHFFWGNYLIFNEVPRVENFNKWMDSYNSEFDSVEQGFITITWSSSDLGNPKKFLDFGFEIETQEVLKLVELVAPNGMNNKVFRVRQLLIAIDNGFFTNHNTGS